VCGLTEHCAVERSLGPAEWQRHGVSEVADDKYLQVRPSRAARLGDCGQEARDIEWMDDAAGVSYEWAISFSEQQVIRNHCDDCAPRRRARHRRVHGKESADVDSPARRFL